jgi:triacylglycerol lipase
MRQPTSYQPKPRTSLTSWRVATSYADYGVQLARLVADPVYAGSHLPSGTGQPVLLIPGFLAGDKTLAVMGWWLARLGYAVFFSGLTWNVDCPDRTGVILRRRLHQLVQETHQAVVIIGHSLGGVLARFLGAETPASVRHVIALGSPIDGSMRVHPLIPWTFRTVQAVRALTGRSSPPCARRLECTCHFTRMAFSALPEGVGFTAIFSQDDEIVDWRACLDPQGTNEQVGGQHLGLIVNRDTYRIIAHTLARVCAVRPAPKPHQPPRAQKGACATPEAARPSLAA